MFRCVPKVLALAAAVAGAGLFAGQAAQAAFTTFTWASGTTWTTASWTKSGGTDDSNAYPNHAGDVVTYGTSASITLNQSVTMGQLIGSGGGGTIVASGSNTITMDNTGGTTKADVSPYISGTVAIIENPSNNGFNIQPNILMANTNLVIASTQFGDGGATGTSGTINASTSGLTLYLLVTTRGGLGLNIGGSLGTSGNAFAVQNVNGGFSATLTAPTFVTGNLGGLVTSVTQNATNGLVLTNSNNVYGTTAITSGILYVGGAVSGNVPNAGTTGNLGFGTVTIASGATLEVNSSGSPIITPDINPAGANGSIVVGSQATTTAYITGTVNVTNLTLDTLGNTSFLVMSPWNVPGNATTTQTVTGTFGNTASGTLDLVKSGTGTLIISGTTGTNTAEAENIAGGTLKLDYTTNSTVNRLSTGHSFRMSGGTLLLHGGTVTETTASGMHLNAGGSTITRDSGTSKLVVTIARQVGGTLNVTTDANGIPFGTTTANDAGSILGGYITVQNLAGTDWNWGVSGNPITGLGSYTAYPV